MNITDKSHIKAIIKRAITDEELMLPILNDRIKRKFQRVRAARKENLKYT